MHQLSAYDSDTDSDGNEDKLRRSKSVTNISGNDEQDNTVTGSKGSHSKQPDFFGLISTDSTDRFSDNVRSECTVCGDDSNTTGAKHVQTEGNEPEIPNGDFWKDFTAADIPTEAATRHPCRKRKFADRHTSHTKMKLNKHSFSDARHTSTCLKAPYAHDSCGGTKVSHTKCGRDDRSGIVSDIQTSPSIKVYSVHPKIAPYLNSHQANVCASRGSHSWAGHSCVINRINWCTAASYSHLLLSASMDTTVRVWNVWGQQQACVRTLSSHSKAVRDVQWSTDGRSILSCSYDRTAAITDVQTGQSQVQLEHSSFVSAGKFHPVSPHLLATGTTDGVQVWDTRSPEAPCRAFTCKDELGQVQDLVFGHDGQELFSCSDIVTRDSADRSVMAWDFRTGVILSNQIFQERYTVTRLCLHPSSKQLLAQTQAGYIVLFSTQRPYKMNKNKRFEGHKMAGYSIGMSVSRDGSLVYSGCAQGKVHCYSFNTGKRIRTLDCEGDVVLDVAAHPVLPSVVASATWGGTLHLFQ